MPTQCSLVSKAIRATLTLQMPSEGQNHLRVQTLGGACFLQHGQCARQRAASVYRWVQEAQGKMQKLKHRSALHHIPEGWRVPAEERWPWKSHPSQWEHGRAGVAEQRRGAGETQKPCARDRAATAAQPVRPAGAVPPGPGSLSGLVEIKQINDNRWASERPV